MAETSRKRSADPAARSASHAAPRTDDRRAPLLERWRARAERTRWLRAVAWLLSWELATLALVALAAGGLWAFAEIADEVLEGETGSLDRALLLSVRVDGDPSDPVGPRWLEEAVRDLTALGSFAVLALATLAATAYLALQRLPRAALFVLGAVLGAVAASLAMKEVFGRARPDLVPHGTDVSTLSFPSGHSMLSAATYLTLGALLLRTERRRAVQVYLLALALLLTVLVGLSRVYLGVHWPTDVLAGWVAGAVWACLSWIVARRLRVFRAPRAADGVEDGAG